MSKEDLNGLQGAAMEKLPDDVIIGDSDAAHCLRQMTALAAGASTPLLLTGPPGCGKKVTARAVHAASKSRNGAFVTINCSALTTDAGMEQILPLQARGGTLFFDEISDLNRNQQVLLEHFIETHEIGNAQGSLPPASDIRIIAATRQGLASQISDDRFRQQLYYQLSLLNIAVPPLRQRRDDITILIDYFMMEKPLTDRFTLNREALQLLHAHYWPGNIAELRNLVARACLFHPGETIGARRTGALLHMGQPVKSGHDPAKANCSPAATISAGFNLKVYIETEELRYIQLALLQTDGVVQHAAELAGLKRTTFLEKMKRHGLRRESFRKQENR